MSRALRALSSAYVERRSRLVEGAALSGAGKRAAFALFYGPLHFLLVRHITTQLGLVGSDGSAMIDLGCGTGAAGAAWASTMSGAAPRILGIDTHPWAIAEAARTYRAFGLRASVRRGDALDTRWPTGGAAIVAAFTLNELPETRRDVLLERLIDRATRGDRVLVVEPLAGFVAPWWNRWRDRFERAGGRADQWRVPVELPAIVAKLDRAAGLNHRELTGRSLSLA